MLEKLRVLHRATTSRLTDKMGLAETQARTTEIHRRLKQNPEAHLQMRTLITKTLMGHLPVEGEKIPEDLKIKAGLLRDTACMKMAHAEFVTEVKFSDPEKFGNRFLKTIEGLIQQLEPEERGGQRGL